jgi:hypothetical protein
LVLRLQWVLQLGQLTGLQSVMLLVHSLALLSVPQ